MTDFREQTRAGLQALLSITDQLDPDVRTILTLGGEISIYVHQDVIDGAEALAARIGLPRDPEDVITDTHRNIYWHGQINGVPARVVVLIPLETPDQASETPGETL